MIDEIYNIRQSDLTADTSSAEWKALCAEFEHTLTDEQLVVFHKLCDLQSASSAEEMRNAYKVGFKDSITLMSEIAE